MCYHGCRGFFLVSTVPRTELSKHNQSEIEGRSSTCWFCSLNTLSVEHYYAVFLHLYYLYLLSLHCKIDQQRSEKMFSRMKIYV